MVITFNIFILICLNMYVYIYGGISICEFES